MPKRCMDGFIVVADSTEVEEIVAKKYNENYIRMLNDLAKTNKTFQNKVKKLRQDFIDNYDLKSR